VAFSFLARHPVGMDALLTSTITCPGCGHRETEQLPVDACQYFYDCKGCGTVLRPKAGGC
jgi:transcription elongation factor Elf1